MSLNLFSFCFTKRIGKVLPYSLSIIFLFIHNNQTCSQQFKHSIYLLIMSKIVLFIHNNQTFSQNSNINTVCILSMSILVHRSSRYSVSLFLLLLLIHNNRTFSQLSNIDTVCVLSLSKLVRKYCTL